MLVKIVDRTNWNTIFYEAASLVVADDKKTVTVLPQNHDELQEFVSKDPYYVSVNGIEV